MINDTLFYFKNPKEFFEFYDTFDFYEEWKIVKGTMNSRGNLIREKPYTLRLKRLFRETGFFRRDVSIAEVVTWLDNMLFMKRLLLFLKTELEEVDYFAISIYMEYRIKLSKNMRIDFVIHYKNSQLVLEMGSTEGFDGIKRYWDKKMNEFLIYKELMSNYIQDRLYVYAFISLYEYEGRKQIVKNTRYNSNQIEHLTEYIKEYIIN